ncbi:hypothetical protein [Jiella sp. M17.18]
MMRWSGAAFNPETIDLDEIQKRIAKLAAAEP